MSLIKDYFYEDDLELVEVDYCDHSSNVGNGHVCSNENIPDTVSDSLECDRILQSLGTPKQRFRPDYLIVSDLAQQHWCGQQILYSLDPKLYLMRVPSGAKVEIQETPEQKMVKKIGSDIHFERELAIQVPVQVDVETVEDVWAIKWLNLQLAVSSFHGGKKLAREIPIFGAPFGSDLFVCGIIDELQFDIMEYTITVTELKTRKVCFPPKPSQLQKDKYQVGLYSVLFNEMVQGKVTKEQMCHQFQLDMNALLSKDVRKNIRESGINTANTIKTLGALMDVVQNQIQTMPLISNARIEYVHQSTKEVISVVEFLQDFTLVADLFGKHADWWQGKRATCGVDVEDCWKCNHCQFSEFCEWREVMANKAWVTRNTLLALKSELR